MIPNSNSNNIVLEYKNYKDTTTCNYSKLYQASLWWCAQKQNKKPNKMHVTCALAHLQVCMHTACFALIFSHNMHIGELIVILLILLSKEAQ